MNKEQRRAYDKVRYDKRRAAIIEKLGGACVRCGATDHLEIDHIDRQVKAFEVSASARSMRPDKLWAEVSKCQLLCTNCHDLKSTLEAGKQPMAHGTINSYTNGGCRCSACCTAHTEHHRAWRLRTGRVTSSVPRTGLVHGTANAYAHYRCRCDVCKTAHAARVRSYRKTKEMQR